MQGLRCLPADEGWGWVPKLQANMRIYAEYRFLVCIYNPSKLPHMGALLQQPVVRLRKNLFPKSLRHVFPTVRNLMALH